LTVEQIEKHSEISVKENSCPVFDARQLDSYNAKLSYLKDGKICRLSIMDDFAPPIYIGEKQIKEWGESEIRFLIPASKWEAFTSFVNDSEILSEDMLLSWQEVKAYQKSHTGNNLGAYKMLRCEEIEDIDVQANVKVIYDMAVEACKVF